MKSINAHYNFIKLSKDMGGVFSSVDIKKIFNIKSNTSLHRKINELIEAKILIKVSSKLYAYENATLESIAMRMYPNGYISLGYALSKHQMVGSFEARKINILTCKSRNKIIKTHLGIIKMSVHANYLHFGFRVENKIRIASPEKAFIDTLYFYLRGIRYNFDVYSEINTEFLNKKLINTMLKKYKNKKFITFFKNIYGL